MIRAIIFLQVCILVLTGMAVSGAASLPVPREKPGAMEGSAESRGFAVPRPNPRRAAMEQAIPPLATGIRIARHKGRTRFVLDLTREIPFRIFTLADPYRVVIDFPEIGFKFPTRPGAKGAGLVNAFRYGQFQPGNSRAVLDLKGPAEIVFQQMLGPEDGHQYRLILDLAPAGRGEFLKTAGWPDRPELQHAQPPKPVASAPKSKPRKLVMIDPGHGGVDPGATSATVGFEKDLVLTFARMLAAELGKSRTVTAVLTRDGDEFLPLRNRVHLARTRGADLFISVHADTLPSPGVSGASVYTLSDTATDEEAAELAAGENRADVIAGVDLQGEEEAVANILINLAQRETNNRSIEFARGLIADLGKITPVLPTGHRQAGFRVLKAPDIPSILLELGFISNKDDARRLASPDWQRKTARSVAASVLQWLSRQN